MEARKGDPPPEAVATLLEATLFWEVAPLLLRAQSIGIPCVLEDAWGSVCGLEWCCPEPKLTRNGVTMWWNRVDIMPNVPKCPVPGSCRTELTEVSGTGIDVVPNLPKCPVPVRKSVPAPPVPVLINDVGLRN